MADAAENKALNVMRAAAALIVVVAHTRGYLMLDRAHLAPSRFRDVVFALTSLGQGAVMMFFVLSGYFVGGSVARLIEKGKFSWSTYLTARLVRLWLVLIPTIFLTLALDATGATLFPHAARYAADAPAIANRNTLTLLGNLLFLQPSIVNPFGSNEALWSLGYEFTYYLVFPLVLQLFQTNWLRRLVALALILTIGALVDADVLILFPVWVLGAGVGWLEPRLRASVDAIGGVTLNVMRCAVMPMLLGSMVLLKAQGATHGHPTWGIVPTGLCATLILVLFLRDVAPKGAVFRTMLRASNRLAHSSFSIYAVHMPILVLVTAIITPIGTGAVAYPNAYGTILVAAVSALLCAMGFVFSLATERRTDLVRLKVARAIGLRVRRHDLATEPPAGQPAAGVDQLDQPRSQTFAL